MNSYYLMQHSSKGILHPTQHIAFVNSVIVKKQAAAANMQPSSNININGNATANGNGLIATPNTVNNSSQQQQQQQPQSQSTQQQQQQQQQQQPSVGNTSPNNCLTSNSTNIVTVVSTNPNTNGTTSSQSSTPTQSVTPPSNNAPKFGTLVPNRIFVGGISANTTEVELAQLFSSYGTVKATKIISDRAGVSKGYGFVTFESEEEAKRLQRDAENIVLRERKLNIAPAIKKQPFSRPIEGGTPGSPPGLATLPALPGAAGFGYFPTAATANAVNAAAALNGPYFQNGGVTYYNPGLSNNINSGSSDPSSGVYPGATLYPSSQSNHSPAVSVSQQSAANTAAVQQQQQACAAASAVVQQNIAAQNAAAIAAAAAAGYPTMLYPPMYMTAGGHPQQYATYPGHVPSNNGFLTADASGIPYSLAPQPTYVLLDTIQY